MKCIKLVVMFVFVFSLVGLALSQDNLPRQDMGSRVDSRNGNRQQRIRPVAPRRDTPQVRPGYRRQPEGDMRDNMWQRPLVGPPPQLQMLRNSLRRLDDLTRSQKSKIRNLFSRVESAIDRIRNDRSIIPERKRFAINRIVEKLRFDVMKVLTREQRERMRIFEEHGRPGVNTERVPTG